MNGSQPGRAVSTLPDHPAPYCSPDPTPSDPNDFADAADKSTDAGIADETAAYDEIADVHPGADHPPSLDEGDPETTDDGSGTSETD